MTKPAHTFEGTCDYCDAVEECSTARPTNPATVRDDVLVTVGLSCFRLYPLRWVDER